MEEKRKMIEDVLNFLESKGVLRTIGDKVEFTDEFYNEISLILENLDSDTVLDFNPYKNSSDGGMFFLASFPIAVALTRRLGDVDDLTLYNSYVLAYAIYIEGVKRAIKGMFEKGGE